MKVAFKDNSFAFEFVRNIGFVYYGGADIGEMMATAARIEEGDFESWFSEWDKLGCRIRIRAEEYLQRGHLRSARQASLRASTYFRMAEFYLHGDAADPRIILESRASQKAYADAARLTGTTWEYVEIPFEGTHLPGYFYKVDDSGKQRPTLIFHGGFDSSLEELFYFGAAGAVSHGYNCLTFDGPGQGSLIREQRSTFRHNWETVVTPVADYLLSRPDVDPESLSLMGMSLGGYLAARAAAFEPRIRAAIFFDGVFDFGESSKAALPPAAAAALKSGQDAEAEKLIEQAMLSDTNLRWYMTQGVWSFGASGIADFIKKTGMMTMEGIADKIECPCLVLAAAGDMFFLGQPQQIYEALKSSKTLFTFNAEDGAENHCQSGALAYLHEVVFNWLDETLRLH